MSELELTERIELELDKTVKRMTALAACFDKDVTEASSLSYVLAVLNRHHITPEITRRIYNLSSN